MKARQKSYLHIFLNRDKKPVTINAKCKYMEINQHYQMQIRSDIEIILSGMVYDIIKYLNFKYKSD